MKKLIRRIFRQSPLSNEEIVKVLNRSFMYWLDLNEAEEDRLSCGMCYVINSILESDGYDLQSYSDIKKYIPKFNSKFFNKKNISFGNYWFEHGSERSDAFNKIINYYERKF